MNDSPGASNQFSPTRRFVLWGSMIGVLASFGIMPAKDGRTSEAVTQNLNANGLAMKGFDPVAYFEVGAPVAGSPSITTTYQGATYRFSSAANRDAFLAEPERFKPAFGGFCAYGVRTGRKFSIDPQAWRIVDNQLYLLLNPGTQAVWEVDRASNIEIANQVWPKIRPFTDDELAKRAP